MITLTNFHAYFTNHLMKGIQQHQDRTERNDPTENQLIFALLYVDALQKRIDTRKVVGQVVESILKPLKGLPLTFQ